MNHCHSSRKENGSNLHSEKNLLSIESRHFLRKKCFTLVIQEQIDILQPFSTVTIYSVEMDSAANQDSHLVITIATIFLKLKMGDMLIFWY